MKDLDIKMCTLIPSLKLKRKDAKKPITIFLRNNIQPKLQKNIIRKREKNLLFQKIRYT